MSRRGRQNPPALDFGRGRAKDTGMNRPLVMTLIGEDKPGLVDSLSEIVAEHGGNWLESRMARLGGHFAGIVRFHVPEEKREGLRASMRALEEKGLTVVVRSEDDEVPSAPTRPATLEVVGHDRPGIVRHLSHTLAAHGVNVEELTTECYSAPMCAEMLFRARAILRIPEGGNLRKLRADLENLAQELMVDLSLEEPAESVGKR